MGHQVAKAAAALIGRGVARSVRNARTAAAVGAGGAAMRRVGEWETTPMRIVSNTGPGVAGRAAAVAVGTGAYRENLNKELLTDQKAYGKTMAKAVKARKPELTRNNQEALAEHFTDIANTSVDIGGTLRPRVERFRNRVERTPSPWNKERLNASEKRLDAATRKLENTIMYARNLGATKNQIKHASKYLDI